MNFEVRCKKICFKNLCITHIYPIMCYISYFMKHIKNLNSKCITERQVGEDNHISGTKKPSHTSTRCTRVSLKKITLSI